MNNFIKERNQAFSDAVLKDEWEKVKKYAKKYGVPLPKKSKMMKAAVYKAVQYCTDIPEGVKKLAMVKCIMLGFNPLIEPLEGGQKNDTTRSN